MPCIISSSFLKKSERRKMIQEALLKDFQSLPENETRLAFTVGESCYLGEKLSDQIALIDERINQEKDWALVYRMKGLNQVLKDLYNRRIYRKYPDTNIRISDWDRYLIGLGYAAAQVAKSGRLDVLEVFRKTFPDFVKAQITAETFRFPPLIWYEQKWQEDLQKAILNDVKEKNQSLEAV
jgi:hypothetical protein